MKHKLLILTFTLIGIADKTALADYGYNNILGGRCTSVEAANDATLDVYVRFTYATPKSISAEIMPSFDDSACTVKLPLGYDKFKGIKAALVKDIQTSNSALTFTTINGTGSGQINYAFTRDGLGKPLQAGHEYQLRFDGMFSNAAGNNYDGRLDTAYYSTSLPAIAKLGINQDGTLNWHFPTGNYNGMKATITFYQLGVNNNRQQLVSTVKYADSDLASDYKYYDFANKLRNGNFMVVVIASVKKIYNLVDQAKWGIPVALKFSTANGLVTKKTTPYLDIADLAITHTIQPNPMKVGANFNYNLVITNQGITTANNTLLNIEIPNPITITKVPSGCQKAAPLLFTCNLGKVAPKQAITKTFLAKAKTTGKGITTVTVTSDTAEVDQTDNTAQKQVVVNP
jgi:Domain of unknown function DUF11